MSAHIETPAPSAPFMPPAPYQYAGGDLGLNLFNGMEPWIYFYDQTGTRWLTHSVEAVLRMIDGFREGRDREQILALVARHYGFDDVWTLIDGRNYNGRSARSTQEGKQE